MRTSLINNEERLANFADYSSFSCFVLFFFDEDFFLILNCIPLYCLGSVLQPAKIRYLGKKRDQPVRLKN